MVACLLSRDWKNRETGLKYMSRRVTKVLNERRTTTSYQETRWNVLDVCCTVLKHMSGDPVYNVYVGALVSFLYYSSYLKGWKILPSFCTPRHLAQKL